MALLQNAEPKNMSGSYERVFNNAELGALLSKVHSTTIAAGRELEKKIAELVPIIPDLDDFLKQEIMKDGVCLATKKQIKDSTTLETTGSEPDFMVFKRREGEQNCHIIELKDGHVFDTKKASAERQAMHKFTSHNAHHIPYQFQSHFCAFNQNCRKSIWEGFKKKISLAEAMTGRDLCRLLEIDYDAIVKGRQVDCDPNVEFFLSELVKLESIHPRLRELLNF